MCFDSYCPNCEDSRHGTPRLSLAPRTSIMIVVRPASFSRISSTVSVLEGGRITMLGLVRVGITRTRETVSFITNKICVFRKSVRGVSAGVFLFAPPGAGVAFSSSSRGLRSVATRSVPRQRRRGRCPANGASRCNRLNCGTSWHGAVFLEDPFVVAPNVVRNVTTTVFGSV